MMAEQQFRKSQVALVVFVLGIGFLTLAPMLLILNDIFTWRNRGQVISSDSWQTMIVGAIIFTLGGLGLGWHFFQNWSVQITSEEIRQVGLRGWKNIPWSQVTVIKQAGYGIHIYSDRQKIIFAPAIFANWAEVAKFITQRLSDKVNQNGVT
jgi:hypothetical protein